MTCKIELARRAAKDLDALPPLDRVRIVGMLHARRHSPVGNVSRQRETFPDYRLRVGDYRGLLAIEAGTIVIYACAIAAKFTDKARPI